MSCSSEERCLCKKHIFKIKKKTHKKVEIQIQIQNIPGNARRTSPTEKRWGRRGGWWRGGADSWWGFQVYRRVMEVDLLAFKPGLSCTRKVCCIVVDRHVHLILLVFNLLFSEQRSREPSHSRTGLTSIGLEIKRTSLSNQTSPQWAPSHSWKTSKRRPSLHFHAPVENNTAVVGCCRCCCRYIPCTSLGLVRQYGGAARPQPEPRPLQQGNNRLRGSLRHSLPSPKWDERRPPRRNGAKEQMETLSYDSNTR